MIVLVSKRNLFLGVQQVGLATCREEYEDAPGTTGTTNRSISVPLLLFVCAAIEAAPSIQKSAARFHDTPVSDVAEIFEFSVLSFRKIPLFLLPLKPIHFQTISKMQSSSMKNDPKVIHRDA